MKGIAFVLLCAIVAVKARNTGLEQSNRAAASLGENPWLVHLRIAVATSGLLKSCGGSLIDNRWVLTAGSCVLEARYIWVRYGVVNLANPSLVTESTQVNIYPDNLIALISIGRSVESNDNIFPVSPNGFVSEGTERPATFCGFGAIDPDTPGEQLSCYEVSVSKVYGELIVSSDKLQTTHFDIGAPLVSDGVQIGVLTLPAFEVDSIDIFTQTDGYVYWIQQETGINFNGEVVSGVAS